MPQVQSEVGKLHRLIDQLLTDLDATANLEVRLQRLIAETAMLRLFYGLDNFSEAVALRLLTNANYGDGTIPNRLKPAYRSKAKAEAAVRAANKRKTYLKWTTLADYKTNLSAFFPTNEHLLSERQVIDKVMEDMRHIRNHIAHSTHSTGLKFRTVMHSIYGGKPRGISPGKLLLSKKRAFLGASITGKPPIIKQYLVWAKVAAKALTRC